MHAGQITMMHNKLKDFVNYHVMLERTNQVPKDAPLPANVLADLLAGGGGGGSGMGAGGPLLPGGPMMMGMPGMAQGMMRMAPGMGMMLPPGMPPGMMMGGMMMPPGGMMGGMMAGGTAMPPADYAKHQAMMKKKETVALMARVYVGSIGYMSNKMTLTTHFSVFGSIGKIDMPMDVMAMGLPPKHRGYAFVEYEYPESAQMVSPGVEGDLRLRGPFFQSLPVHSRILSTHNGHS
jgi:hypothetical protein